EPVAVSVSEPLAAPGAVAVPGPADGANPRSTALPRRRIDPAWAADPPTDPVVPVRRSHRR
ncbi:MAG: histidinol-phosphate aminotransferase family protein, partial [Actinomycetota bacterium]|nr:histidinol-phosphate aminotransferase family protein [Actinomycetota bacterium]